MTPISKIVLVLGVTAGSILLVNCGRKSSRPDMGDKGIPKLPGEPDGFPSDVDSPQGAYSSTTPSSCSSCHGSNASPYKLHSDQKLADHVPMREWDCRTCHDYGVIVRPQPQLSICSEMPATQPPLPKVPYGLNCLEPSTQEEKDKCPTYMRELEKYYCYLGGFLSIPRPEDEVDGIGKEYYFKLKVATAIAVERAKAARSQGSKDPVQRAFLHHPVLTLLPPKHLDVRHAHPWMNTYVGIDINRCSTCHRTETTASELRAGRYGTCFACHSHEMLKTIQEDRKKLPPEELKAQGLQVRTCADMKSCHGNHDIFVRGCLDAGCHRDEKKLNITKFKKMHALPKAHRSCKLCHSLRPGGGAFGGTSGGATGLPF